MTTRTLQSRLLLRPSAELNELILGAIGRALDMYDVKLHAYIAMSNHVHLLLSPANADELAKFMRDVNRDISIEAGHENRWQGKLWGRRYRGIVVADPASQVAKLRYLLSNGCKEGFVSSPRHWPGATCAHALIEEADVDGKWLDRSAMHRARHADKPEERWRYETWHTVELTPLPCWSGISAEDYRRRCAEMIADIERETAVLNAELGREPMGADWVLEQDPHSVPRKTDRRPAPLVHAASKKVRETFLAAYRSFVEAYRRAAALLRQGYVDVAFPEGSFPPPRPFVHAT